MQHLESLALLEERVQQAVDRIRDLKREQQRLEAETDKLREENQGLDRRVEALAQEKDELLRQGQTYREKEQEWTQYERDREEIRTRIDTMLAKFEELEI